MKLSSIVAVSLLSVSLTSISFAASQADRHNDGTHKWLSKGDVIENIHKKYGHTAAGESAQMKHHGKAMHHSNPTFRGNRGNLHYKHLTASEYKRFVIGN